MNEMILDRIAEAVGIGLMIGTLLYFESLLRRNGDLCLRLDRMLLLVFVIFLICCVSVIGFITITQSEEDFVFRFLHSIPRIILLGLLGGFLSMIWASRRRNTVFVSTFRRILEGQHKKEAEQKY